MSRSRRRAFSLVELVIVIVIIGVISAIAIPRLTRSATGAAGAALKGDLAVLRNAIEMYRAEHEGRFPDDKNTIVGQLTMYTKVDGTDANVAADVATGRVYGPYLKAIPPLPVGKNKGETDVEDGGSPGDSTAGWWYDKNTGEIFAHLKDDQLDRDGVRYNTY